MADIELVIKMPEESYKATCNGCMLPPDVENVVRGIKNGTPLPKGHGDLIDRSKIYKAIPAEEDNCTGMGMTDNEMYAYNDGIDAMYDKVQRVKPIIEADKVESEEV